MRSFKRDSFRRAGVRPCGTERECRGVPARGEAVAASVGTLAISTTVDTASVIERRDGLRNGEDASLRELAMTNSPLPLRYAAASRSENNVIFHILSFPFTNWGLR